MTVLTPYHVNVNCSVLDRSLSVYRDVLGFVPQTRTSPEPQPGAGFGLDVAQWDAWILQGGDEAGVVLDLLEWIEPRPVAAPAARTTGFLRLVVGHPTPGSVTKAWGDAGLEVDVAGPTTRLVDPDGTVLELVEAAQVGIVGLVNGSIDVDRTRALYIEGLGFEAAGPETVRHPGNGFAVSFRPAEVHETPKVANELGIFRMAALSTDIDTDHRDLVDAGARPLSDPVSLDMGPGLPDDLRASFLLDPDGACVELIEVAAR